jgi:hypothetical protein
MVTVVAVAVPVKPPWMTSRKVEPTLILAGLIGSARISVSVVLMAVLYGALVPSDTPASGEPWDAWSIFAKVAAVTIFWMEKPAVCAIVVVPSAPRVTVHVEPAMLVTHIVSV